jgi:Domain of unknown function (DUF397)
MDTTRQSRPRWRKPARSGSNGNCVEIAATGTTIAIRDSRDPQGPQLAFTPDRWKAFTAAVKTGHH